MPWTLGNAHTAAIVGAVSAIRPSYILEWGSGESTETLRRMASRFGARLESIDNSPGWVRQTGARLIEDRDQYVSWPVEHAPAAGWGAVLVDGRWRSRCLRAIHGSLAAGALVFLHDAERDYYHEAASKYCVLASIKNEEGVELWILSAQER